jgi:hypothetical protein
MVAFPNSNAGARKRNVPFRKQGLIGTLFHKCSRKYSFVTFEQNKCRVFCPIKPLPAGFFSNRGACMKSLIISTAIILAIGLGGAWASRALSGLASAVCSHQLVTTAPT